MYLVWMLNLYNFMDGIDGLASAEALCVCLGSALIYFLIGQLNLSGGRRQWFSGRCPGHFFA